MKTKAGAVLIACLLGSHAGSEARGQDKFYTVIFGVQDGPNRFREAHSFATFARVRRQPVRILDQATISWLPASGIVDLRNRPERGTNHPLKKSLELVTPAQTIAQWGPFEVREELFDRAKKQDRFLQGGGILYKAVDFFTRPAGVAVNCEHAIADIVRNPGEPFVRTGTARGHWGSFLVARHLRSWIIDPNVVHDGSTAPSAWMPIPLPRKAGVGQTDSTDQANWPEAWRLRLLVAHANESGVRPIHTALRIAEVTEFGMESHVARFTHVDPHR